MGEARAIEVFPGPVHEAERCRHDTDRWLVRCNGPLAGQTLSVGAESTSGAQSVAFEPVADGVRVARRLHYAIKRRSRLTLLTDRLFVGWAMARSLAKSGARFGAVLGGE